MAQTRRSSCLVRGGAGVLNPLRRLGLFDLRRILRSSIVRPRFDCSACGGAVSRVIPSLMTPTTSDGPDDRAAAEESRPMMKRELLALTALRGRRLQCSPKVKVNAPSR